MPNPPVPFPLKVLRGNPGKRPMKFEPRPEQHADVPEPPAFITGYAADEWWRTASELHRLGLLIRIDVPSPRRLLPRLRAVAARC
jgi:phage terminase small subunit